MKFLILVIGLAVVLGFTYFATLDWRRAVKMVLVLVIFEGAIRKWILPQASELIFFLKDFILLGAYIKYYILQNRHSKLYSFRPTVLNVLLFMMLIWSTFQVFNPSLGSPIVGLLGLKNYFFYVPLLWMVPDLFSSENNLYLYFRKYLLLTIPIGLLGIVQFLSPASSLINTYAGETTDAISSFSYTGIARITGTFSYITGYAIYLIVCFCLLIPLLSTNQVRSWRWIFFGELFLVFVNMLMNGSRGAVITMVLFGLGYLVVKTLSGQLITFSTISRFIIPSTVVLLALVLYFQPAYEAFSGRTTGETADSVTDRLVGEFIQPYEYVKIKELDGYGTGATYQAVPTLRKIMNLPPGEPIRVGFEGEPARIILELGPIGYVLWYGLRWVIIFNIGQVFLRLQRPFLKKMALTILLWEMIQSSSPLVFNPTFAVYYWFLSGFIFLLPRLEQTETVRRNTVDVQSEDLTIAPNG